MVKFTTPEVVTCCVDVMVVDVYPEFPPQPVPTIPHASRGFLAYDGKNGFVH